jgi:hypothetical protein
MIAQLGLGRRFNGGTKNPALREALGSGLEGLAFYQLPQ